MNVRAAAVFACLLGVLAFAGSASAGAIGLYRNNMESTGLQAQIVNFAGERCQRGGSGHAFRIFVGKRPRNAPTARR